MSEKLTLVLTDELSKAISNEATGKYLSRQQFILEAVREKLEKANGGIYK
jgi:predicted transcriptional regulator